MSPNPSGPGDRGGPVRPPRPAVRRAKQTPSGEFCSPPSGWSAESSRRGGSVDEPQPRRAPGDRGGPVPAAVPRGAVRICHLSQPRPPDRRACRDCPRYQRARKVTQPGRIRGVQGDEARADGVPIRESFRSGVIAEGAADDESGFMLDVLFSVIPGHGHFFPNLPLGRALAAVRAPRPFRFVGFVRSDDPRAGLRGGRRRPGLQQAAARGDTDDPGEIAANLMVKMFRDGPPVVLETLTAALREDRPDVVLVDTEDFGAQVAAERVGVPAGSVVNGVRAFSLLGRFPFDMSERDKAFDRGPPRNHAPASPRCRGARSRVTESRAASRPHAQPVYGAAEPGGLAAGVGLAHRPPASPRNAFDRRS